MQSIVRRLRKAQDIILHLSERQTILHAFYLADLASLSQHRSERAAH